MQLRRLKGLLARALILGVGIVSFAITILHILFEENELVEIVIGYTFPISISLGLVVAGVCLQRKQMTDVEFWRIGVWGATGILAMAVFQLSEILYQIFEGTGMSEPSFALLHAGSAGALGGVLVGFYDVRSRQRARRLREQREWSDRLREGLLVLQRVMRHDIRTALSVIQGSAEALREEEQVDSEHTEMILDRVTALDETSTKVRQIEPLAEREKHNPQTLELTLVVQSAVERIKAERTDASVTVTGPELVQVAALPEIESAFYELIENAIAHNGASLPHVKLDIQQLADSSPSDSVVVRVADNGPGIPHSEIEVIETGDVTQLEHGSGVGLWLAKWIVEQSDGTMSFDLSQEGTTVTVELPAASASE
jgi:two-component system OmpR family sensor kinase